MTLGQLENFISVAQAGSFSAAAEKLYISPQALIQQISKMEAELGFRLFLRSSKGVSLSTAGEEYYRGVRKLLEDYHTCTKRAARKAKKASVLRIGLPDNINSAFLLSICALFSKKHPEIELRYENYSIEDTSKAIAQGRADICAQIKSGEDAAYFSMKLFPVVYSGLVAPSSPLAPKDRLTIEDLVGYTVGVWGPLSAYRSLSAYIASNGLDIRLQSLPENFSEALIFCVEGHVLLGSTPLTNYLKGSLAVVPIEFDFGINYYLSYSDAQNEAVQKFLSAAKEAAASETHPWKRTLGNLPIDK